MIRETPETRPTDAVELRATRAGNSMAMRLSRSAAEAERGQLECEGWTVEILEVEHSPRV